jgi:hypothetical protein
MADDQPNAGRGRCLTLCRGILPPLEPPLLFCSARSQRAIGDVAVPHAVRMIAVFDPTTEQQGHAVAGNRPAAMMRAQVQETDWIGDSFPGQIDRFRRCRLRTQNKSLPSVKIRCVARKSMGETVMPNGAGSLQILPARETTTNRGCASGCEGRN